jgi:hypothetical protein
MLVRGATLPDVVVVSTGSNAVVVYRTTAVTNGVPTFAPAPRTYFVGTAPASLTVSDINGDDIPDMLVANPGSNDVSVLFGAYEADGAWVGIAGPRLRSGGAGPIAVTARPMNGDAIPDLVVTNGGSGTLTLLVGVGQGFFDDQNPQTVRPVACSAAQLCGEAGVGCAATAGGGWSLRLGQPWRCPGGPRRQGRAGGAGAGERRGGGGPGERHRPGADRSGRAPECGSGAAVTGRRAGAPQLARGAADGQRTIAGAGEQPGLRHHLRLRCRSAAVRAVAGLSQASVTPLQIIDVPALAPLTGSLGLTAQLQQPSSVNTVQLTIALTNQNITSSTGSTVSASASGTLGSSSLTAVSAPLGSSTGLSLNGFSGSDSSSGAEDGGTVLVSVQGNKYATVPCSTSARGRRANPARSGRKPWLSSRFPVGDTSPLTRS